MPSLLPLCPCCTSSYPPCAGDVQASDEAADPGPLTLTPNLNLTLTLNLTLNLNLTLTLTLTLILTLALLRSCMEVLNTRESNVCASDDHETPHAVLSCYLNAHSLVVIGTGLCTWGSDQGSNPTDGKNHTEIN